MQSHPDPFYDGGNFGKRGANEMEPYLLMWLNPINLGILFVCICAGIWILAHCAPTYRDK
jgi:hypothetical protein